MALSLQVIYPINGDSKFDFDYYLETHIPLVTEHMGEHIQSKLVTRGLAGGPDTPPGYYAIATIVFADQAALDAALAESRPVLADIANFTNVRPDILVGETVSA